MAPLRHLGHAVAELCYLSTYAACSVVGTFVRLPHVRDGHRRPVVLVPGFLGRTLSFSRLQRGLVQRGHPVYALDLGFQVGCIASKSRQLEAFLATHDLDDCYLVGHSMGGLISLGIGEESRRRVRHFVTLGTAFYGANLSYLLPVFPAARQLNPGSALLGNLNKALAEEAGQMTNLTTIMARWDEIVILPEACRLVNCANEIIADPGHVQLIMGGGAVELVCDVLHELEQ